MLLIIIFAIIQAVLAQECQILTDCYNCTLEGSCLWQGGICKKVADDYTTGKIYHDKKYPYNSGNTQNVLARASTCGDQLNACKRVKDGNEIVMSFRQDIDIPYNYFCNYKFTNLTQTSWNMSISDGANDLLLQRVVYHKRNKNMPSHYDKYYDRKQGFLNVAGNYENKNWALYSKMKELQIILVNKEEEGKSSVEFTLADFGPDGKSDYDIKQNPWPHILLRFAITAFLSLWCTIFCTCGIYRSCKMRGKNMGLTTQ